MLLSHTAAHACTRCTTHTGAHHGSGASTHRVAHSSTGGTAYRAANYRAGLARTAGADRGPCSATQGTPHHSPLFTTHALADGRACRRTSATA